MMHSCSERKMMIIWSMCLIFSVSYSILVIASPVSHLCRPDQRDALWDFKSEFYVKVFNFDEELIDKKTERWRNNTDCCFWDGVSCDPKTGNVVELDLMKAALNGRMRSNSSLFKLQHFESLVLDNNNISGVLPDSVGNLKDLSVLRLRGCSFFGKIPSSVGNLSHLTYLDLRSNDFTGELPDSIGNLKWLTMLGLGFNKLSGNYPPFLHNLSELTHISLSYNQFKGMLSSNMSSLSKLVFLHIRGNSFYGKIPSSIGNLSHLIEIDLGDNEFTGEPPDSIGNLKRLTKLELDCNNLSGNFPHMLLNLSELTDIHLDQNQFKGVLPSNMSSLSKLESFGVNDNSFYGSIPSSFFMIPSLSGLYLGGNDFSGSLAIGNISSPSKFQVLNLGRNNFNGPIPGFISKLVGLHHLDITYWNTGRDMVDFSIFSHLTSLEILFLSFLNTRSMVDLSLFSNLKSLRLLHLSGNNLKINSVLHLPPSVQELSLWSCNISEFPKFLQTKTNLSNLDISANQIGGQVPEWLWRLPLQNVNISHNLFSGFEGSSDVIQRCVSMELLDISSNNFYGPLPLLPNSMTDFLGSHNRFSGEIPKAICKLVQLSTLVLSNNNFNGSIPRCFENFRTTIMLLHLQNNSLLGGFPKESMGDQLRSLDIGHNQLSGELPKSFINCTRLVFLNVEDNRFNDTFPFWLRLLPSLQILILRSNDFHGPISSPGVSSSFPMLRMFDISGNQFAGVLPSDYFAGWSGMSSWFVERRSSYYHQSVVLTNKGSKMELIGIGFTMYKTIDLSGNRFEGNIPESIGSLKELIVLNMSNNAFTGHIPPCLSYSTNLQSLDLSENRLSGKIPSELGKLTFLAKMNFSHNRLEGPIPQGTQFQTQNSSSFAENLGLCGAPLQETCGREEEEEATTQKEDEEKEEKDPVISWIAAAIAYVPGIFCGFVINHILNSYRQDWFMRIFRSFT